MLELGVEFGWDVPSPYRGLPFLIAPVPRVSRPLLPASSAIATINFVLMALNRVNQIQINSTTPGHSSLWAFAWIHERNSLIQVDLRASGWDSLDIQRRFLLTFIPDNLQLLMVFASQASRRLQIQIRYGFKLNVQDRIQTSSVSQHLLLIATSSRVSRTPLRVRRLLGGLGLRRPSSYSFFGSLIVHLTLLETSLAIWTTASKSPDPQISWPVTSIALLSHIPSVQFNF